MEAAPASHRQVRTDFGFNAPFDPEGRLHNKALAGGTLIDADIYPISFSRVIARAPITLENVAEIGTADMHDQSFYLIRNRVAPAPLCWQPFA